jgi:hypothetical protein
MSHARADTSPQRPHPRPGGGRCGHTRLDEPEREATRVRATPVSPGPCRRGGHAVAGLAATRRGATNGPLFAGHPPPSPAHPSRSRGPRRRSVQQARSGRVRPVRRQWNGHGGSRVHRATQGVCRQAASLAATAGRNDLNIGLRGSRATAILGTAPGGFRSKRRRNGRIGDQTTLVRCHPGVRSFTSEPLRGPPIVCKEERSCPAGTR